ncbi:zinc-binding protein A33-like isoform X3 [Leucoraja erinacea]|uniref:zinc-binding protein A33-like isoform X3 n=1 Tax=Leucoraja erinaceus TaxID=7782 RepID=UPI002454DD12|nr:zinc-binding protein A33-like isoform X3 [Leucoraja erinacea]
MASKDPVESLTEDAVCPICMDFFTDPVALECGHNFCRSCITQSWDREERISCPECREEFTDRTNSVSRTFARLSEKARTLSVNRTEKESKLQCEEHQEELKLFCETDKKLICVICAAGREHRDHRFMPVKEAVETYKDQVKSSIQSLTKKKSGIQRTEQQQKQKISGVVDQVKSSIQSLTKKQSGIQRMEQQQKQKISGVLEQSHNLQSKITSQYAELHQILTEKEQRTLADIREEEKKILNTMEKNLQKIQENLSSIQEELVKLQQQMDRKDCVVFLKEEAGRKRRVRDVAKPLSVVDEALSIEKFNCPVSFNTAFKETSDYFKQVSVTLDVETAHPWLEVSEDRKRVRWTRTQRSLPDTGKRFTYWECVLGSEGFTSGRHYWEVEVAESRFWSLGVAAESVERKRGVTLTPETGVWSIGWWLGDRFDAFTSPPSRLPARPIPRTLGVYLNYESGTVSFYDADTKSHLYTFTGNKFTEKLYPFFWTWDRNNWLRICSGSAPGV